MKMSEPVVAPVLRSNDPGAMRRWLVKVRSKRGLALRNVFIVAPDEHSARDRVQQMYLLSEIATICPSAIDARTAATLSPKR
jgi:hypothetical protein